jgi:hypothetical protein
MSAARDADDADAGTAVIGADDLEIDAAFVIKERAAPCRPRRRGIPAMYLRESGNLTKEMSRGGSLERRREGAAVARIGFRERTVT